VVRAIRWMDETVMSNPENLDLRLERALNSALSGLPPRRAPGTLESRVLNELARRAALPWWRLGFAQWPAAARVAFVLICAALIAATILGGVSAFVEARSLSEVSALVLRWMQPFLALISSLGGLGGLLLRVIPPLWLYGGLAFGIVMYLALFGLGAAAYHTLYSRPSSAGSDL
jgi:hypothetical protein